MPISTSFSLQISLDCSSNDAVPNVLNKYCGHVPYDDDDDNDTASSNLFAASCVSVRLSLDQQLQHTNAASADVSCFAILVPPSLTQSALQASEGSGMLPYQQHNVEWIPNSPIRDELMRDVFARIHSSFCSEADQKYVIKGIITNSKQNSVGEDYNWPADIVLVEDSHGQQLQSVDKIMELTNGQTMVEYPEAIIKVLPITTIYFHGEAGVCDDPDKNLDQDQLQYQPVHYGIPTCPVCLHRIDPLRIGLPKPSSLHLCSKFCSPVTMLGVSSSLLPSSSDQTELCSKQRLLQPWSPPAFCVACHVLQDYWKDIRLLNDGAAAELDSNDLAGNLFCHCCAMQETLWVCLTCGFVGCGRYSNKHAEEHFNATRHVFSLELATLRIWDYASGEFAHRGDILECSSLTLFRQAGRVGDTPVTQASHSWTALASSSHESDHSPTSFASRPASSFIAMDEKAPKKATMIGEEYEALLQSALEDQAQHYEGEITRLRAALTAEEVDESCLTREELEEVTELRSDIARLRDEIDYVGRQLLDAQAQEAGHRAMSQRLLREQQVAQSLLDKIHQEAEREHGAGKRQVEELEQQIADLTANLRMRDRFSQHQELSNAQIMGAASATSQAKSKKGKTKLRRLFRK